MQDYRSRLAESPQDLEEIIGPLADAGVDLFDPSVRYFDTPAFEASDMTLSGWTKKITGKLTLMVGGVGIGSGAFAEAKGSAPVDNVDKAMRRFDRGEFDILAIGRALIGDPDWANKALTGRTPTPYAPYLLKSLD